MAVNVNIPKPTYTKNDVGLGNVDNTSDLNKPVSTATQTALDGKVDKVTGKGLSENDFTNTLKTKLDGIQDGAEVNVNADWNATSGDAQILNKPTIPSITGLVPYTGATSDVDLDAFGLDAKFIKIKGTAGNGHLNLKHQSSGATAGGSESVIYADNSGNPKWKNDGNAVQNVMLENSAITGATKTKITYDAKGLVTAGTDATTADIADTSNKRYVTDANLVVLGNTSNTNTGDETQASILSKLGIWNIQHQTAGTASSGTTQTITKSIALPSVPNFLNFRATFFRNSGTTNTFTARAYLSEVDNNIGGTAILIATVTGANSAVSNLPMKRTFDIVGGTTIYGMTFSGSQVTDDVNISSARGSGAIPTGTPLYLIFTVQCANASDSARFESAQINNFSF